MSKWISVYNKLPEKGKRVLCLITLPDNITHFVYIGRLCNYEKNKTLWIQDGYRLGELNHGPYQGVTHWMPLPEPPKEPNLE